MIRAGVQGSGLLGENGLNVLELPELSKWVLCIALHMINSDLGSQIYALYR